MSQTLPLSIITNRTSLLLGYTVLNLDRTEYAAFALATESAVPGTYYAAGGYAAPDAGGYVVISESDGGDPAVLTPLEETDIDPKVTEINSVTGTVTADVVSLDGQSDPLDNLVLSLITGGLVEKINSMLEAAGQAYRFTAEALAEGPTGGTGLTAQQTRDAMKLAPTAGTPADGSIDDHLDDLAVALAAATSTLTVVSAVDRDVITIYQAVSFQATISGLAIPAGWTKLYFTVKSDPAQADADAIIQMVETATPAVTDGLLRLNGAAGTAANGTLTVNQATGVVVIDLVDDTTAVLALATGLHWSLKALYSTSASILLAKGTLNVRGQATAAVT